MVSVNTNVAALSALSTLRSLNSNLEATQNRISSGYRVDTASDNAAYWSIATTMRSDERAMGTVQDALALGAAVVDTAYSGTSAAIDVVTRINAKLVAAREPGVDRHKITTEINQLKQQLLSIAESSSFNGFNLMMHDESVHTSGDVTQIVSSFNRSDSGGVSVGTLDFQTTPVALADRFISDWGILTAGYEITLDPNLPPRSIYYLLDAHSLNGHFPNGVNPAEITVDDTTTSEQFDDMLTTMDRILGHLTDSAADLGALSSRIKMQDDFMSSLRDTINKGVGRLVDADMNDESSRLRAYQAQQQLGLQSLSIANANASNILSLFQ